MIEAGTMINTKVRPHSYVVLLLNHDLDRTTIPHFQ